MYAQFSGFNLKTPNQQLVEQAIRTGLFVMKQAYQLEDTVTHQRFGRYGNADFGVGASLAIRTTDGYIISSALLTPWLQDANFERYKNTHRPILSHAAAIEFGDSTVNPINISVDSLCMADNRLSLITSADSLASGFEIKSYSYPVEGWCVWVSDDSTATECSGREQPELTIFKQTIEFASDSVSYEVEAPNTDKDVWGGIFIVPEQTAIGQITFYLGGVFIKQAENDKWNLVIPILENNLTEPRDTADELTPLTTAQSNNKDNKRKR